MTCWLSLEASACEQLLAEHELVGSLEEWARLVQRYEGNPLALNIVAETITDLFAGTIGQFLAQDTLIFGSMFGERFGLVNTTLAHIGIGPILWQTDPLASHVAIATMVNFRWTGYNALILLAGMQAIPRDLYESAAIDGAGKLRRFFSITIGMSAGSAATAAVAVPRATASMATSVTYLFTGIFLRVMFG